MTQVPRDVIGYPKLATYMGLLPEVAIFRRFGDLSSRNLLYFQAELVQLSKQLRDVERRDEVNKGMGEKSFLYCIDWSKLAASERGDGLQLRLILRIRETLKEYQEALLRSNSVADLSDPTPADLKEIQSYLHEPHGIRDELFGMDSTIWGSPQFPKDHAPDLASLRARHNEDIFSRWVRDKFLGPFFRRFGYFFKKEDAVLGVFAYKDSKILQVTHLLTTLIASTVLIASINVLNYISSSGARLGAIAAFSVLFSLCLHIFANCNRIEIFAVTSAFAAVQVVFVSTNNGPSNCKLCN